MTLVALWKQYPAKAFTDAGFNHYDIYFDDCTVPDRALVDHWFDGVCHVTRGNLSTLPHAVDAALSDAAQSPVG